MGVNKGHEKSLRETASMFEIQGYMHKGGGSPISYTMIEEKREYWRFTSADFQAEIEQYSRNVTVPTNRYDH